MDKLKSGEIIREEDEIRICGEWIPLSETSLKVNVGREVVEGDFLYRRTQ